MFTASPGVFSAALSKLELHPQCHVRGHRCVAAETPGKRGGQAPDLQASPTARVTANLRSIAYALPTLPPQPEARPGEASVGASHESCVLGRGRVWCSGLRCPAGSSPDGSHRQKCGRGIRSESVAKTARLCISDRPWHARCTQRDKRRAGAACNGGDHQCSRSSDCWRYEWQRRGLVGSRHVARCARPGVQIHETSNE